MPALLCRHVFPASFRTSKFVRRLTREMHRTWRDLILPCFRRPCSTGPSGGGQGLMSHGVLVVEDDADIRESLIEILEESGFPTVGAANGHEALERLRRSGQPPCLILLDLMMPVMGGISLPRRASQDSRAGRHSGGGALRLSRPRGAGEGHERRRLREETARPGRSHRRGPAVLYGLRHGALSERSAMHALVLLVAAAAASSPSPSKIALPAPPPVIMDYLAASAGQVWVPAGNTGKVFVLDVAAGTFRSVEGFPTKKGRNDRLMGPSSVALGQGHAFIGNRGDSKICAIDARTLEEKGCVEMPGAPDGTFYVG